MSHQSQLAEQLTSELSDFSTLERSPEILKRVEILLADFLICVASANRINSRSSIFCDAGMIGLAAHLSSQAALEDMDDLDWSGVTHPGSVIFATSLASTISNPALRENFLASVLAGMRTTASFANFFGARHRARWHMTATAGGLGSTSATSAAFGHDQRLAERALTLAGANIGGTGQVSRELQGTSRFNRAAATSLGITAALGASAQLPTLTSLWDGDRGLIQLFDIVGEASSTEMIKDGITTVRVRSFPATGFIHSALLGVSQLARTHLAPLKRLNVEVSDGLLPILTDPRKDRWWNLPLNCAAAWTSGDPMDLTPASEVEPLVHAVGGEVPLGSARIWGESDSGSFELTVDQAPGLDFFAPEEISWRKEKWDRMVGKSHEELVQIAHQLIWQSSDTATWQEIDHVLRGE